MKMGIELLKEAESFLDESCGCDRPRCKACNLRREVGAYLDIATSRTRGEAAPETEADRSAPEVSP